MKIGVDIQALQARESTNRDISRYYTQSVVEALLNQQTEHSYRLYANSTLPAPTLDINSYHYKYINYPYIGSCSANELFLQTTLLSENIEAIFIPSPLEDLEATIFEYTKFPKKVFVICHNLIPLIFLDKYLDEQILHSRYIKQLEYFRNADFIFAISEATRKDAINYLNISSEKVINISSGVSPFFTPVDTSDRPSWLKTIWLKFGISKKFLFHTGRGHWYQNLESLVNAFSKLQNNLQDHYELVIASNISENTASKLTNLAVKLGIARSVILINSVTDEELRALYSTCSLFVFPSLYEEFALPVIEAMACGAPVIASNNSSLPEIVGSADQLFDAQSPDNLAKTMQSILCNENFRKQLSETAPTQATHFSWQSVADKISEIFKQHNASKKVTISFKRVKFESIKTQVAFFSPFSPIKSGISDYSEELIPQLSKYCELDLYQEEDHVPKNKVFNKIFGLNQFEDNLKNRDYEAVIYQLGNSSYHCHTYSQLLRYSGISVLHDYYLGGLLKYMNDHFPELGISIFKEIKHNYELDKSLEIINQLQSGRLSFEHFPELKLYLNRRIFTRSLGVILHSKWAYNLAIKHFNQDCDCITYIPHLMPQYIFEEPVGDIRQKHKIPINSFLISAFGFVSYTKRPLQILYAFSRYLANYPNAHLVFVGEPAYIGSTTIENEICQLNLNNKVTVTGYVNKDEFYEHIKISDICLNLRFPFKGETSGALLRIMSVGKPVIVTDIGSFSEFPDSVVFKIPQPVQNNEVQEIYKALVALTENLEYRDSLGQNAATYIAREHSPERCALLYAEFIERVLHSPCAKRKLLADYVGREASKFKVGDPVKLLTAFAKVIQHSFNT